MGVPQIARRLMGKILIDLRNTREEAISVTELKHKQETAKANMPGRSRKQSEEGSKANGKLRASPESSKQNSVTEKSYETDDDDDKETQYRLDPK